MIYLTLLVVIMFCSGVMDADALDAFDARVKARYERKPTKFNAILVEWVDSSGWENKWHIRDWMVKHLPEFNFRIGNERIGRITLLNSYAIYSWLAADVLVVFLDLWHFAKAIMMGCMEYTIAVLSIAQVNEFLVLANFPITNVSIGWFTLILFLAGGMLFNFFYYRLRKQ
jgi:hypothetical protein